MDPERNDIRKVNRADDYLDIENHFLAERKQRKAGHLEVAGAERDADDGDAADKTEDEVRRGDLPPPQQDPKHIHEYAEAASGVVSVHNLGSEWP